MKEYLVKFTALNMGSGEQKKTIVVEAENAYKAENMVLTQFLVIGITSINELDDSHNIIL